MAERRMFAKTIIDSDAFLDMPLSTQALYFHLSMRADDEGFVNNPKKIARMIGADDDSLKLLVLKQYIIPFESGVVVIKHWKIHNYIRGDRLTPTSHTVEKTQISTDGTGAYTMLDDVKELQALDCKDMRKIAYQNSTLPYSFTYKMRRAFDGKTCPVCKKTMSSAYKQLTPTIQHNKPISQGGEHEIENISIICLSCNTSIQDQETNGLNNQDVINTWERIVFADKHKIKWFDNPAILDTLDAMSGICPSSDCQNDDDCQTQDSIGKVSIGKDSIDIDAAKPQKHKHGEFHHVLLTDAEYQKLIKDFGETVTATYIRKVDEYCEQSGKRYKNYYLAIRNTFMARDGVKPQGEQSLENGRYMKDGVLYDRYGNEII